MQDRTFEAIRGQMLGFRKACVDFQNTCSLIEIIHHLKRWKLWTFKVEKSKVKVTTEHLNVVTKCIICLNDEYGRGIVKYCI